VAGPPQRLLCVNGDRVPHLEHLNNPSRVQLMEQAKDFRERAKELEAQTAQQQQQQSKSE